jgi:hypothetical protein
MLCCAIVQGQVPNGGLTDPVLQLPASLLLGPCKVQDLILSYQHYITCRGIAALYLCPPRRLGCPLRYTCA